MGKSTYHIKETKSKENDEERRALIHKFYQIYRPIQKNCGLRYHIHFDVYGNNFIEIWEYAGEKRGRRIVYAKEDTETACYKRAIEELEYYGREREGRTHEQRAAG